jgi:hypothetical protein
VVGLVTRAELVKSTPAAVGSCYSEHFRRWGRGHCRREVAQGRSVVMRAFLCLLKASYRPIYARAGGGVVTAAAELVDVRPGIRGTELRAADRGSGAAVAPAYSSTPDASTEALYGCITSTLMRPRSDSLRPCLGAPCRRPLRAA